MLTLVSYPQTTDGDKLAEIANSVLETYKQNGGHVVRTDSVRRTETKPAEHLLVVLFRRDKFLEASFARFQLRDGVGTATIYGHRTYGADAAKTMGEWLKTAGESTEKSLMGWTGAPKVLDAQK